MPWIIRTTTLLSLILLPFYIYAGFRLAAAILNLLSISKRKARVIVFLAIFWFYLLPILMLIYSTSGNVDRLFLYDPQLHWQDYLFLFPFWCGLITLLEILPFFVVLDIINLISRIKTFSFRTKWIKWQACLKIGLTLFFVVYVGIRTYLDTNHVRTTHYQVTLRNLPAEFQNLNLYLIGDLHIDRYTQNHKLNQVKKIIQSTDSDFLFFSGDLVTRGKDYIQQGTQLLCQLRAKYASIACMGDHDFWSASRTISQALEECGWTFLENQHHLMTFKGRQILVTGITHIYSGQISQHNLKTLLANAPDADLKILLVHQPAEFLIETANEYGYHLVLAGHTHGGQIVHHLFGIPNTPSQSETRFYSGLYKFKNLHVIVTNGIGLTLAPLRYHAPAEVTKITLENVKP